MIGVLLTILLMIGISMLAGASEMIEEAFSGDWMQFEEQLGERERLEMENTEWSWGHNIKNYVEEYK